MEIFIKASVSMEFNENDFHGNKKNRSFHGNLKKRLP